MNKSTCALLVGVAGIVLLGACSSGASSTSASPEKAVAGTSTTSAAIPAGASSDSAATNTTGATTSTGTAGASTTTASASTATTVAAATTTAADTATTSRNTTADTITVTDINQIPEECVALFVQFFKDIEPLVNGTDWSTATIGQFDQTNTATQPASDKLDEATAKNGCDKYNLSSGVDTITQLVDLATAKVPGTAGYLQFLLVLVGAGDAPAAGPADCDSAIAAAKAAITGKTLKTLTAAQYASTNATLTAVSTVCASDKANAFLSSAEVTAFYSG